MGIFVALKAADIDDLITGKRKQQPGDKQDLLSMIASAPFKRPRRTLKDHAGFNSVDLKDALAGKHPDTGAALTDQTVLDSAQWHALKHRIDFGGSVTTADYERAAQTAGRQPAASVSVFVGKSGPGASRVGVFVPPSLAHKIPKFSAGSGHGLWVVYDPAQGKLASAYAVKASRMKSGYPAWVPRTEVTT